MRLLNHAGQLALSIDGAAVDVAIASQGAFGPDVDSVYERWDDFRAWAATFKGERGAPIRETEIGPPVVRPAQVFAVGLNYKDHAAEANLQLPDRPVIFTKFPASVTGPYADVVVPPGSVDFETELVAVIGRRGERVLEAHAWAHVAGLTVGQDLSEREMQFAGPPPQQFSLAKSFTGFAPIGPVLVTPDEFANPDDLELGCTLDGEQMQKARTRDMIFSIPKIIAYLSAVLPLLPGDLIFTGTPAGIGWARTPKRLLTPGRELVTTVEGIGTMRHHFISLGR